MLLVLRPQLVFRLQPSTYRFGGRGQGAGGAFGSLTGQQRVYLTFTQSNKQVCLWISDCLLMFHTNTKSLKTTGLIEFKVQRRTELTVAEGLSSAWPSLLTVLKGPAPSEGLSPCGHKQTKCLLKCNTTATVKKLKDADCRWFATIIFHKRSNI